MKFLKYLDHKIDDGKLKWKLIDLFVKLSVPIVLVIGGFLFNTELEKRAERVEDFRYSQQQELEESRHQEEELRKYLDIMKVILIDTATKINQNNQGKLIELKSIAQARTGTALRSLNQERRNLVLDFLRYANLGFNEGSQKLNPEDPNCLLKECFLFGINLGKADLSNARLGLAYLKKADLVGADLRQAQLSGADLREAKLRQANLSGAYLYNTKLSKADLRKANLSGSQLEYAENLSEAKLERAFYTKGKEAEETKFPKNFNPQAHDMLLIAPKTNLSAKELIGVDLREADLRKAILDKVNLTLAKLEKANLTGAQFTRANLNGANLNGADLTGADLTGADLTGADLTGADLTGTKLTEAILCNTILPHGDISNQDCPEKVSKNIIFDFLASFLN